MACGCNKIRKYTQSNPLVFGEPDGSDAVYVRSTIAVMTMRANSEFWAAGSGVEPMLQAGWLIPA